MDLDRQAIERRDFPIGRRGYDRGEVDAHLRALAAEFEELRRTAGGSANASLASTAGTQVQSILQAAETAAADIERSASEEARRVREAAAHDAEQTREEALEKARAHVAAVAEVSATLLERVGSMDAEVSTLVAGLRSGGGRLSADLAAVEAEMGELYGAASGTGHASPDAAPAALPAAPAASPAGVRPAAAGPEAGESKLTAPKAPKGVPAASAAPPSASASQPAVAAAQFVSGPTSPAAKGADAEPSAATSSPPVGGDEQAPARSHEEPSGHDLDGARLVALNMALNGESRVKTERYLAENYQLPDRLKLVDEVYAAIEG